MPEDASSAAVAVFFSVLLKEAVSCQDYKVSVIDERMNVEYWWNNADRGKQKYSGYKPFLLPLCPQEGADGSLRLELSWSHCTALWVWPVFGRTVTPFICTAGAILTRAKLVIIERFEINSLAPEFYFKF
jgi:hypothetical protein